LLLHRRDRAGVVQTFWCEPTGHDVYYQRTLLTEARFVLLKSMGCSDYLVHWSLHQVVQL